MCPVFLDDQGRLVDIVKKLNFPSIWLSTTPKKHTKEYQETLANPLLSQRFQKDSQFEKGFDDNLPKRLRADLRWTSDIHHHIFENESRMLSVQHRPTKKISATYPIMLGSQIDLAIRHQ
ncbi:hypothetical protein TNCV_2554131, partial [Trichonephila clavipes]